MKHLLRRDLSKRFGNLKGGVSDVIDHRFFSCIDKDALLTKQLKVPHLPELKGTISETESNFATERLTSAQKVEKADDPFLKWE